MPLSFLLWLPFLHRQLIKQTGCSSAYGNQKAIPHQYIANSHIDGILYLQLCRVLVGNARFYSPLFILFPQNGIEFAALAVRIYEGVIVPFLTTCAPKSTGYENPIECPPLFL